MIELEWQQLEYFRVVAKIEHFTKAAEILSISQPALTRSITKMEQELGIALFDRVGRTVRLNKYGKLFLKRVEKGLLEISTGIEEIHQLQNPHTGSVSFSFLLTLGIHIVPEIISHFNEQYPGVELEIHQSSSVMSIHQLIDGEIDYCLIGPIEPDANIVWHLLFQEELFAYVPANHRLASKQSISLDELANDHFIGFKKGIGMREMTESFCQQVGFTPKIKFEGEDVTTLAGLVSSGLGVTIIPEFSGISSNKIKKLKISNPYCQRDVGIAWMKGKAFSPTAELFRNFIIEMFKMK
ncbi:LysR family transcriptional regulator [Bacillus massiliigorillae]|uniref:LysR family transcriptional regulator n=1 Tax=Bacillus massiliigorillae TaxID=1243664 RepID=UPI0003AA219D|nr:LysR family transcriptional regulator [Bacillus massiliigorillae]